MADSRYPDTYDSWAIDDPAALERAREDLDGVRRHVSEASGPRTPVVASTRAASPQEALAALERRLASIAPGAPAPASAPAPTAAPVEAAPSVATPAPADPTPATAEPAGSAAASADAIPASLRAALRPAPFDPTGGPGPDVPEEDRPAAPFVPAADDEQPAEATVTPNVLPADEAPAADPAAVPADPAPVDPAAPQGGAMGAPARPSRAVGSVLAALAAERAAAAARGEDVPAGPPAAEPTPAPAAAQAAPVATPQAPAPAPAANPAPAAAAAAAAIAAAASARAQQAQGAAAPTAAPAPVPSSVPAPRTAPAPDEQPAPATSEMQSRIPTVAAETAPAEAPPGPRSPTAGWTDAPGGELVPVQGPQDRALPIPLRASGAQRAVRGGGWLGDALRTIAVEDPALAGRLELELLSLQGIFRPVPISYDLVVPGPTADADTDIRSVTVSDRGTHVLENGRMRPDSEAAHVFADHATLGTFIVRSQARFGRFRRSGLRISGSRRASVRTSLRALAAAPVGLREVDRAGIVLRPVTQLRLAVAGVRPEWTIGHRFTIAFADPEGTDRRQLLLGINDGAPLSLTTGAPYSVPDAIVTSTAEAFTSTLTGTRPPAGQHASIAGAQAPLVLLQAWVSRLEAGR